MNTIEPNPCGAVQYTTVVSVICHENSSTLVVFTSDNGGLATSEGWPTSNLPLRGGKGWIYEGGIREPLLVR